MNVSEIVRFVVVSWSDRMVIDGVDVVVGCTDGVEGENDGECEVACME